MMIVDIYILMNLEKTEIAHDNYINIDIEMDMDILNKYSLTLSNIKTKLNEEFPGCVIKTEYGIFPLQMLKVTVVTGRSFNLCCCCWNGAMWSNGMV